MKRAIPLLFASVAAMSVCGQSVLYPNEFDLSDVKLHESRFADAQSLNVKTLLSYDTDRLLAPFMKAAGLEPKGESFSNWDGLDGHVGGHYLSALSIHYASTGDEELKKRIDYMLSQLAMCAAANADGYVGGVPGGDALWKALRNGDAHKVWDYWVPWYNVHKIYAGLRDSWLYAGSKVGRNLFLGMCDWGIGVISNLSDKQMEEMLGNEFGGMDEVYADAYAMTGEQKYLDAARRFTHHQLFDDLVKGVDNLDNRHANTQVPKVVGYQRIAELSGDTDYRKAAEFFWETVVGNRSLSFGGNSRREHFASSSDAKSYVDDREGPESCNTNNMLKLTEGLFRMKPDALYADFYERALFNHILSTQHPEHGGYVYFTSARPGHYRVYSKPNSAMWCCVGTGMENHGKYGQFIYTHTSDSLFVNLFIPSEVKWNDKNVRITQSTSFPADGKVRLTVNTDSASVFSLAVRHPGWCDAMDVRVNGKKVKMKSRPSSYITLEREWKNGDVVELDMPMKVTIEELNYLPDYVSILRGPIVMAARFDNGAPLTGLVADDSRWAHIAHGPLVSVFDTPLLIGKRKDILRKLSGMKPSADGKGFVVPGLFDERFGNVVLEPFAGIHDSRYMIYWLSMTPERYAQYKADAQRDEEVRLALDRRTVDAVNTGEQQPEADHFMESRSSVSGNFNGEPWRDASNGGFFSYVMKTDSRDDLTLRVRYWGNESGSRSFSILVDGELLAKENIAGKWNRNGFMEEEYSIPQQLVKGKDTVKVRFESEKGNTAGGVFHIRLLRPSETD